MISSTNARVDFLDESIYLGMLTSNVKKYEALGCQQQEKQPPKLPELSIPQN
jgi:hypothetical protein